MNLIKSSGAVLGAAAMLSLGASGTPRALFLASISLGRDQEIGIIEPREQEPVVLPTPIPAENDSNRREDWCDECTAALAASAS